VLLCAKGLLSKQKHQIPKKNQWVSGRDKNPHLRVSSQTLMAEEKLETWQFFPHS